MVLEVLTGLTQNSPIIAVQVLGAPPESLVRKGERSYRLIDSSGKPRYCTVFKVNIVVVMVVDISYGRW